MKKIGAEMILGTMTLPWIVWVTVSLFSSQSADAVQETKQDYMVKLLEEVRADVKTIKEK